MQTAISGPVGGADRPQPSRRSPPPDVQAAGPSPALLAEAEAALGYAREQHAPATRKAYAADFAIFRDWCGERGLAALPALPATVATFLGSQAQTGAKPSTLSRRLAAIRYTHALDGAEAPTAAAAVRATMKGIRRVKGVAALRKTPATADRLVAMVRHAPDTLAGLRDRALLLLGFAGAFRRSELVALMLSDLEFVDGGLRVTIRRSKTDQEGQGDTIAVIRGAIACPVDAVRRWIAAAEIVEGPLFRRVAKGGRLQAAGLTPHSVGLVVKAYADKAGFRAAEFGGHSLRAGFLTSAAMRGASLFKMMDVSRHKTADTLRGYVRRADEFRDHAGAGLL